MRKSFKYRLYPNKTQTLALEFHLDSCREIYNAGLQERRDAWTLNRHKITFAHQSAQIPDIRSNRTELLKVQARVLMQSLRQLDRTFAAFFRRCKKGEKPGHPRFKAASRFNSFVFNRDGFRFRTGKLNLSNIGNLRIKLDRPVEGDIKEVIVKREGNKWFAVLSCEGFIPQPLDPTGARVGIDVGIESFATLSDGLLIENPRIYEGAQRQLRIAQRRVARRKKGSNRRRKAWEQVRTIHQKVRNQRKDFQHKLSTLLIHSYDTIAVEDLNVEGLASGILAKQIRDAAWSAFIFKLTYKAEWAGRQLIKVPSRYTSQDCSRCKHREKKSLAIRVHNCSNCGLSLHRDHNAALNILAASYAVQDSTWAVTPCVS